MAQFRQLCDVVAEKKQSVSERFAQKLELKLKIAIDFGSRKRKKLFILYFLFQKFQTTGLRSV